MEFFLVVLLIATLILWLKLNISGASRSGVLALWGMIFLMAMLQFNRVEFVKDGKLNYIHTHDYFHYLISSKYFEELGYDRLYVCSTAAFSEINKGQSEISAPNITLVRNLANPTIRIFPVDEDSQSACRQYFPGDRWQEFVGDLAVFLKYDNSQEKWQTIFSDMGNNATPAWYMLTRYISNNIPLNEVSLHFIAAIDLAIFFILIPLVIFFSFGPLATAGYFIVIFGNALAHTSWVHGSFGRALSLFSLALAYCLFHKGKNSLAALFFVLASSLRIFPIIFVFSLILFVFLDKEKRKISYTLMGYTCLWGVVFLFATYATYGIDAWQAFINMIGVRINMPGPFTIGLEKAFSFFFMSDSGIFKSDESLVVWLDKVSLIHGNYKTALMALGFVLGCGFVHGLRQLKQPMFSSVLLGFFMMFFFMTPLTYYYMFLALVLPVYRFGDGYRRELSPFMFLMMILAIWSYPVLRDLGYVLSDHEMTAQASLIILIFFFIYIKALAKARSLVA